MTTPATGLLASIDLSDNNAFVQQVPHGWFNALRRTDPVQKRFPARVT